MKASVMVMFALGVLAVPLRAQTAAGPPRAADTLTVRPGDARLDVERWVPRRVTWRVTIRGSDGSGTVQGFWTDVWARSEEEGRPTMVFRTLFVDTLGTILVDNETVFDAATLRVLRSRQKARGLGSVSYRYSGDSVSGTVRPAGAEPRPFTVTFDEPAWDPIAPVLGLLPFERLEPGDVVRYPVWNQTGPGDDVAWRTEHVDSVGRVRAAGGATARAWYHTMTTASAPGVVFHLLRTPEPPYTWWFRVERPALTREWDIVHWRPLAR